MLQADETCCNADKQHLNIRKSPGDYAINPYIISPTLATKLPRCVTFCHINKTKRHRFVHPVESMCYNAVFCLTCLSLSRVRVALVPYSEMCTRWVSNSNCPHAVVLKMIQLIKLIINLSLSNANVISDIGSLKRFKAFNLIWLRQNAARIYVVSSAHYLFTCWLDCRILDVISVNDMQFIYEIVWIDKMYLDKDDWIYCITVWFGVMQQQRLMIFVLGLELDPYTLTDFVSILILSLESEFQK